ncbi:MAG TPA: lysylphosphatidylglycerol synthase domain-containing protein [Flavobacteriales bacterium]|nr:lysylphosphatidylglycerol synthase domain-containing protein [Flavobacteriales bacterium]
MKAGSFTLTSKNTNRLTWVLGLGVFITCIAYVLNTLFINPAANVDFRIFSNFDGYAIAGLFLMVMLIAIANMGIECYKWWFMARQVQDISYTTAIKSVLTGLAVGFITPNRLGDFPGRAMQFKKQERGKIILMNLLSGYAQFITICMFAVFSVFLLPVDFSLFLDQYESLKAVYITMFVVLLAYHAWFLFNPEFFLKLFLKVKWFKPLGKHVNGFYGLSVYDNFQILHFSFLRSALYTLQLLLILYFFDNSVPVATLFLYANIYFFILTVAPSFALNKLGIRESISVIVFSGVIHNPVAIVVSVLLLWVINQVIPACIGAWLLFNRKAI